MTRNASNAILNGITRLALIGLAREDGIELVERSFTAEEVKSALEAFITSSSTPRSTACSSRWT